VLAGLTEGMKSVEDLDVFKLAHELALKIYAVSKKLPKDEQFGLVSQMRRSATSVGMNLTEGSRPPRSVTNYS